MLKAKDLNGNEYLAYQDEIILDKGYFCPCCNEPCIPKLGNAKVKHFAHYNENACEIEPESIDHIQMKMFLMKQLRLTKENLEVNLKWSRPDILINNKIAIECQCSKISKEEFDERNKNYAKHNIYVLWIFNQKLINDVENNNGYFITVPKFMMMAHELYFGRLYIFNDARVNPIYSLRLDKPEPNIIENSFGTSIRHYKKYRYENQGKSIEDLHNIICIDNYGYKIARFNDKKWW